MTAVAAGAADYPSRTIKVVVPFAAAGVTDIVARVVFDKVANAIGQSVVIDNRPGAGGTIAVEQVANAPADGYTLVMADPSGSLPANVTLYPALKYHPIRDLTPIAIFGNTGAVLLASNELPVKTAQELVALAKSKPGELTFASTGVGTPGHLNGELFSRLAGIKAVHVPYRVVGQAVTDLIAGRISFWIAPIPTMLQNVRQGQLRPLAVAGEERSSDLPGTPTVKETGIGDFDASTTYASVRAGRHAEGDRRPAPRRDQSTRSTTPACRTSFALPASAKDRSAEGHHQNARAAHPAMGRRHQERRHQDQLKRNLSVAYVIAIDIGGTFTDLVACDVETGAVAYTKSPTTYGQLGDAIFDCIRKARSMRARRASSSTAPRSSSTPCCSAPAPRPRC